MFGFQEHPTCHNIHDYMIKHLVQSLFSTISHFCSIEYWFRVLDVDGDGYLSLYEMEYFYSEMLEKMEQLGIEGLPVLDSMCQVSMYPFLGVIK